MGIYRLPVIAAILAIIITTLMDFTGYTIFSALPLFGLTIIFWVISRLSKKQLGLSIGSLKFYGLAILYPVVVLSMTALIAIIYGDFSVSDSDWGDAVKKISVASTIGVLMVLLTEEGFFRGLLWGLFRKEGMSPTKTLMITSGLFTIWHISAVTSGTDYGLPGYQIPIYLINASLLGLIWGLLRMISGSVLVASVSHAVWNGLAYELFGFGEKVGSLGIENTLVFGPEVGFLGIVLNSLFFYWLWKKKMSWNK